MDERTEERSTSMSAGDTRRTQQVEEIRALWARVKPSVWTVPMLTALEQGVKGGKWFRLNDTIQRWPNAFFAKQGLCGLVTAHAVVVQSSRR